MFQCAICPVGTFADTEGSVECRSCDTACNAYQELCSASRDSVCMPDGKCPEGWDLDPVTRICTMCARGYINISNVCTKCPQNFFCESKDSYSACQDIRIFERAGKFVTVPTSPSGSFHPTSCLCSEAGGFEGGSAVGLFGCTACRFFFSLLLMEACP